MRSNRKTLERILNQVDEDELKAAVKKYASSNKDFLFFLQLKFLHLLPTDEPGKKYGSFLSNSFRYWLDKPEKINITATKKIQLYSEELRQQCLDMISLQNYIEAYGIIKNLLLYNSLLIEKTWPNSQQGLLLIHREILITYHKLAEQKLARPLKEELLSDLQSLLITGSVRVFEVEYNAINLLTQLLKQEGKAEGFFNSFYNFLLGQLPKSSLTAIAVKSFLIQTVNHSSENWTEKLYQSKLINNALIYEQCEQWLLQENPKAAAQLAEKAIHFVSDGSRGPFYEIICKTKVAHGSIKEAIEYLLAFAADTHTSAPMIEKAIASFPDSLRLEAWKRLPAGSLIKKLDKKKEKLVVAHLLAWLDYPGELLELAQQFNSTYLLMPFNKNLFRQHPDQLLSFYTRYIDDYLENHIGQMSIQFTSKLLEDIKRSGAPQLADQLSKHITKKFSHRKSVNQL